MAAATLVAALLTACGGGGGGNNGGGGPQSYAVGGTVSGLSGTGLVLQNNGSDDLPLSNNGSFAFATRLASGAGYAVTVRTQPSNPSQTCLLVNSSGTIGSGNVTNVALTCTTAYTVGGIVSGLSANSGLVLQNGGDELTVSSNGSFVFGTGVSSGTAYNVTVKTQPAAPLQTCTVVNASGTMGSGAVADVVVSCDGIALLAGALGGAGSADGVGTAARFYRPYDIAIDAAGNLFVADGTNHTVRKITAAGVVSILAGAAGVFGSANGNASDARFTSPRGIVTDVIGNVYVADSSNHAIRKITPAGVVSTFAGAPGSNGFANGTGGAARFAFPNDIVIDSSGNLYVADTSNHVVRKITPAGVVTTFAGTPQQSGSMNGSGTVAQFYFPLGLAADTAGNVYVTDTENHTIRKITPSGLVSTLAGTAGQPGATDGSAALFRTPSRAAVDSAGNLLVADAGNHTVRMITPGGVVSTVAGVARTRGFADGSGTAARFNNPNGVDIDSAGNVYVADTVNHTIRKISPAGTVTTVAGTARQSGSDDGSGTAARFSETGGVAADSAGNVYVVDYGNKTLRKITPAGVVSTLAGLAGFADSVDGTGPEARFLNPIDAATDSAGNVYVSEEGATIRKITPAGVVTTLAGLAGVPGSEGGSGSAARFGVPYGIATDSSDNVYVADKFYHTIRKITPAGLVSTLAGTALQSGSEDGTAALFAEPGGIATDSSGNVYVADTANHTIRRITPAGFVTTIAGAVGQSGSADGSGGAARFDSPNDVAVDSAGNVYVADHDNHSIRRIAPDGTVTTVAGAPGSLGVRLGPVPGSLSGPKFIALLPGPRVTLVETDEEGGILTITLP